MMRDECTYSISCRESCLTDQQIVEALIQHDGWVTQQFFFVNCRPLFQSVIRLVFSYPVDYNEFVNELYYELMRNDAEKLRTFAYRSSLYQWLKIVSIRYFVDKRDKLIDDTTHEPLIKEETGFERTSAISFAAQDLQQLFACMTNKRYVFVLQKLMIEDVEPQTLANELCVTVNNLYNIKKRALLALAQVVLKDRMHYERRV